MTIPLEPYYEILRNELATTLMPDDENAKRVAEYSHRILTALLVKATKLPAIEQDALTKLAAITPRLSDLVGGITGGMILVAEMTEHLSVRPNYELAQSTLQRVVSLLAKKPSDEGKKLLQEIAEINADAQQTLYQAILDADVKPQKKEEQATGLSSSEEQSLQMYLRTKFTNETNVKVGKAKVIIGGGSKRTLFVKLKNTTELPDTIVLRIDKPEGVVDSSVVDEYAIIEAVYDAGLPVPKPYALETDTAVLGAPFIIVSRIKGHNIGDWVTVFEPSREFAVGMAQTLAKLHKIPVDSVKATLRGANQSIKERMSDAIADFEASWRASGKTSVVMEQAYAWLKSHMDFAEGPRAMLHCDAGCHNMLGEDGKLTALLDWETVVVGNPALDLTYTENTIKQMMPWDEYLAEYEKAGGTIPSDKELDFYRMWRGCFRIHYQFLASSFFLSGLSSSMVHAYSSQRLFMDAEHDVHQSVKSIYPKY